MAFAGKGSKHIFHSECEDTLIADKIADWSTVRTKAKKQPAARCIIRKLGNNAAVAEEAFWEDKKVTQ